MRFNFRSLLAAACVAAPSLALAHGPQLGVIVSNGKLATGVLLENENAGGNYAPAGTILPGYVPPYTSSFQSKTVYAIPLVQYGIGVRVRPSQSTAAGYDVGPGIGFFPSDFTGRTIKAAFTSALTLWNGSTWIDPGDEELRGFRNNNPGTGSVATYAYTGDLSGSVDWTVGTANHGGATWTLGTGGSTNFVATDTTAGDPTDNGVYRVSIQYSVTGSPTIDATTATFLLYKNVSQAIAQTAADSLGVDPSLVQTVAVPEPVAALLLPAALLLRRRR